MQALVWKQTTPKQFVGFALALGLVASLALNVVLFVRSDDGATQPAATQNVAPVQQRTSDANTGQIDVNQLLANQSVARAEASSSAANSGQIDVDQMIADKRFAPTARDRFIVDAGE